MLVAQEILDTSTTLFRIYLEEAPKKLEAGVGFDENFLSELDSSLSEALGLGGLGTPTIVEAFKAHLDSLGSSIPEVQAKHLLAITLEYASLSVKASA